MEGSCSILLYRIVRIIIYTLLLACYLIFYLKGQLSNYIKGRTTISSRFEEATEFEWPTVTLCMSSPQKASIANANGFTCSCNAFSKEPNNQTLLERFEELSYMLDKDFTIQITKREGKEWYSQWKNVEETSDFEVKVIRTTLHGTCYKFEPKFMMRHVSVMFNVF